MAIITMKSSCHPEANGRQPLKDDQQWVLTIPLEDGMDYLELKLGKKGRDAIKAMFAQEEEDDKAETSHETST